MSFEWALDLLLGYSSEIIWVTAIATVTHFLLLNPMSPFAKGGESYSVLNLKLYLKVAGSSQSRVFSPTWAKGYIR